MGQASYRHQRAHSPKEKTKKRADSEAFYKLQGDRLTAQLALGDQLGRTSLHYAAARGDAARVEDLLKARIVPVDACCVQQQTPLHFAALAGEIEIVALLLAHGARIDIRDFHGVTALELAALAGHASTVKMLLEHCNPHLYFSGKQAKVLMQKVDARSDGAGVVETSVLVRLAMQKDKLL